MKTLRYLPVALSLICGPLFADQNIAGNVTITGGASTGNLTVTGVIDSEGNVVTFGTQGTVFGAALLYQDNATDTFTFNANRNPASWLWQHSAAIAAMRLDSAHQLILYQADGATAGVTLAPASNSIKLGTHANGTLTADANGVITAGGGFAVAGGITNTNGSLTGGTSGLTLNAGGTNQSITLTPSGTGRTAVNWLEVNRNSYAQLTGGNVIAAFGGTNGGGGTAKFYFNNAADQAGTVGIHVPTYGVSKWSGFTFGGGTGLFSNSSTSETAVSATAGGYTRFGSMSADPFLNANVTFTEWARFASNGNLLVGTATDNGNGKLQLATHTTGAGGIGFGADVNLYRSAANTLATDNILNVSASRVAIGNSLFSDTDTFLTLYPQVAGNSIYHLSNTTGLLRFTRGAVGSEVTHDMSLSGAALTIPGGSMKVLIGGSTALTASSGVNPMVQIFHNTTQGGMLIQSSTNDSTAAGIYLQKSRAGTGIYTTAATSGDYIGFIGFEAADGVSAQRRSAAISVVADGTFSPTSAPALMKFQTTPAGSISAVDRLTISSGGVVNVHGTTPSTSTTTGALTVGGGAGIAGTIHVGGEVRAGTNIYALNGSIINTRATDSEHGFRMARSDLSYEWNFSQDAASRNYDAVVYHFNGSAYENLARFGRIGGITFGSLAPPTASQVGVAYTTEATIGGAGSLTTAGGIYAAKKIIGGSEILSSNSSFPAISSYNSGLTGENRSWQFLGADRVYKFRNLAAVSLANATDTAYDFRRHDDAASLLAIARDGNVAITGNLNVGGNFSAANFTAGVAAQPNQAIIVKGTNAGTNIASNTDEAASLFLSNKHGGANTFADIRFEDAGGNSVAGVAGVFVNDATNQGDLSFTTRDAGSNLSEKMRILGNGNVGIGTAFPSAKLEVSGDGKVSGGMTAGAFVVPGVPNNGQTYTNRQFVLKNWYADAVYFAFESQNWPTDYALYFVDSASEQNSWRLTRLGAQLLGSSPTWNITATSNQSVDIFRVRSSANASYFSVGAAGNVGIGTTTPATRLMVADDNVTSGGVTIGTGTVADGGNLRLLSSTNHWNLDNYTGDLRFFTETGYGTGGATRMTLTKEGNLTVGGTFSAANYTATSGALTGGSSGLSLGAGGTNQNITLSPSGTGQVIVAPGKSLRVGGYGGGTNDGILFSRNDTGSMGWMGAIGSTNSLSFGTGTVIGSSTAMSLNLGSGNLLLGTSTDYGFKLGVAGTATLLDATASDRSLVIGTNYQTTGNGASGGIMFSASNGSTVIGPVIRADASADATYGKRDLVFKQHSAADYTTLYEAARITADGKLGIGTSSPTEALTLGAGKNLLVGSTDTAGGALLFRRGFGTTDPTIPAIGGAIFYDHNGSTLGNSEAFKFIGEEFRFRQTTAGNDLLTIKTNGFVGVGTSAPAAKLSVSQIGGGGATRGLDVYQDYGTGVTGSYTAAYIDARFGGGSSSGNLTGLRVDTTQAGSGANYTAIFTGGNVGIGTTSPGYRLDVTSAVSASPITNGVLRIVGTGSNPATGTGGGLLFAQQDSAGTYSSYASITGRRKDNAANNFVDLDFNTGSPLDSQPLATRMTITANGNVGIGTTAPTHTLSVKGTIRAQEIIVDNTNWADYVFEEDYRLAPLAEVESHIKAKKHLPGIPSASEVAEHGVSMGEMQAKLLSKVEELTLHLIAQEKEIAALKTQNASFQEQLAHLKATQP